MLRAQDQPRVDIILVKYNVPRLESETIQHVVRTTGYDNYGLRAHLAKHGDGLAKTWNRLIAQSDAEYICLLNTDTVPTQDWLANMVSVAQAHNPCAVVPSSNRVHLSQIPVPFEDWNNDVDEIEMFAQSLADDKVGEIHHLATASAMCVLFPRSVWETLGGFDEDFQFYGEDTAFFYRMTQELDRPVLWARWVYVHHYGSQSFIKAANDGEVDYSALRQKAGAMWQRKKEEIDERVSRRKHG